MRKKARTSFLLAVIICICITGCGKKEEKTESVTTQSETTQQNTASEAEEVVKLTLWGSETDLELLGTMVESFKEEYADEASFDITIVGRNEATCKDVLLADANADVDVFTFVDDQLMIMAAGGVLEPISNQEEIRAINSEGSSDAATASGVMYAYPMTADNGYFLYYNKAYFSEQDVESLDTMLEIAAQAGKKITMQLTSGWYLYSFFSGAGLMVELNDDGVTNYCNWNSNETEIKGIDVAKALSAIALHDGFVCLEDADFIEGAKNGSIIAGINGTWNASNLQEAWGDNYAAVKLPTYNCAGKQVQMSSFAGYKMVGVNTYSKEKEWAQKLAEWITNEENQTLRFVEREQGPSNINAAASEEIKDSIAIQALIAQSQYATQQRIGEKYWDPVTEFAEALLQKKMTDQELQELLNKTVAGITASVGN